MASQHPDKRIRLFLERRQERLPFDITQKAEEIYLPDGDPAEKLRRKIKTITELSGDNYDQFTESVAVEEEHQDEKAEVPTTATGDQDLATINKSDTEALSVVSTASAAPTLTTPASTSAAAANTRIVSPQAIYAKLWHAQSEIGLALDVLNIIISSYQLNAGSTSGLGVSGGGPMSTLTNALPPGSLKCEYVPKAPLPLSTQISNEKMAIGGKKHQLRSAADILMQGAQKLKKVMADESQFWEDALRLRKNNWCIVAAKGGAGQPPHHHHGNRLSSGSQLFVHYGFRDVGSLSNERAYAELVRSMSYTEPGSKKSKSVELHIPNKTGKLVAMSLVHQGAQHTQEPRGHALRSNTLHKQLLDAQSTLFDNELFQELINEARTMTNSVSIVDNEIFLPVNDELELKISFRTPTLDDTLALSSTSSIPSVAIVTGAPHSMTPESSKSLNRTAEILRCAMQLMQHRKYRQNIKERTESFFKSSRPGGGRTAGSFGQIQQTLQQRPTAMLSMALQALQYYAFSRRIRESLNRVTTNVRQSWWEAINVHIVDINDAPRKGSTTATGTNLSHRAAPCHGMGSAVSIHLGSVAPAIRLVLRSHPMPCVVFQLSDRPSSPVMHVAEFEQILEQELAARAIGRICEVLNTIRIWNGSVPTLQSPEFVIDIDGQCVGVFQIPQRNGTAQARTTTVTLRLDMKTERAVSIFLACKQGERTKQRRICLEDQSFLNSQDLRISGVTTAHPYDSMTATITPHTDVAGKSIEGFRTWLKNSILAEIDL
ncbi:MAG: subunit 17 of mediator complex-domain-containing protein [Benniella sp.]|nr:MAG: subunit 17 of mediator complex-domain-containing protein [Benniella sp.]